MHEDAEFVVNIDVVTKDKMLERISRFLNLHMFEIIDEYGREFTEEDEINFNVSIKFKHMGRS